jgi:hypothetical protein
MSQVTLRSVLIGLGLIAGATVSFAEGQPSANPVATPLPYRAFENLIGDWDTGPENAPASIVQRFSWGPNRSYIWYRTSMVDAKGAERLHFEGPMVWNAATGGLDYLFVVEPGSLMQEQGDVRVQTDGSIVREVKLTGSDGTQNRFRQTFRLYDAESGVTSLMRQTATGWVPNFPGSDKLHMKRRRT